MAKHRDCCGKIVQVASRMTPVKVAMGNIVSACRCITAPVADGLTTTDQPLLFLWKVWENLSAAVIAFDKSTEFSILPPTSAVTSVV